MNEAQVRAQSERLYDMIASDGDGSKTAAAQELTDYTRLKNREGSFASKIIEPSQFDRNRLVPQMHIDQSVMLFEYETDSPFAVPVDYGTTPSDFIPRGRRYPVVFGRTQTQKVVIDLLELQTYQQDLRQILADNMVKDLVALRDQRLIKACRRILGGVGVTLPWVGKAMYQNLGSALTFSAFARSKNIMRDTQFHIEPATVLMHHTRRTDFEIFAVEEFQGTDKAIDIAFNGFSETEFSNLRLLFTIKDKIVPHADVFYFGPQEYLGRYVNWVQPTMSLKKEDSIVQYYIWEVFGITIANPAAVSIVQFL